MAVREAHRTHYVVTNQRVLILTGVFGRRIVELTLRDLPAAQLEVRPSGLGTITFGPAIRGSAPPGWPTFGMPGQTPSFSAIRDAARAYRTLEDAKAAARQF